MEILFVGVIPLMACYAEFIEALCDMKQILRQAQDDIERQKDCNEKRDYRNRSITGTCFSK